MPATLAAADRERIRALSQNVSRLWQAEGTTAQDRKQIIRCLVDQVTITIDRATEENEVTIAWKGGMSTVHQAARAVGTFEQLKDYRRLTERIRELHGEGLHLFQIAAKLNEEGFVPPRRRGKFTESGIGDLVRKLGLVGELFRDNLLRQDEWWISDLASRVGVGAQKIHYWVQQGWINYRRTPSGKHFIVWADAEDLRRLKKIATKTNSWTAARHPDLVIPKKRSVR